MNKIELQGVVARLIEVDSLYSYEESHQSFSLFYILKGSFNCQKQQRGFVREKNQFLICNSSEKIRFNSGSQQNKILQLTISFPEIEKLINQDWRPFFRDDLLEEVNEEDKRGLVTHLFQLCLDLANKTSNKQLFSKLNYLVSFLEQLNKMVLLEHQGVLVHEEFKSSHPKIKKIIQYVENSYTSKLSLQEVAKREYLSEAYLSRLFKEETGINFSDYVDTVRLNHGINELRNSQLPILTIALNSGFSTSKRFSMLFKEKYGVNPSDYRNQWMKEKTLEVNDVSVKERFTIIEDEEMLQIIAQFMLNMDIRKSTEKLPTHYELLMDQEETKILTKPEKIINIGLAQNGLTDDARNQIRLLQEKIPFEYIRFFGLCEEANHQHHVIMDQYANNHRLFTFINEMRLKPIIVLNITLQKSFADWQKELKYLRKVIQGYVHFEASFRAGWYLELKFDGTLPINEAIKYYEYAYFFLDQNFTTSRIGLTVSSKWEEKFKKVYENLVEQQITPDFLSYNYEKKIEEDEKNEKWTLMDSLDNLLFWLSKKSGDKTPSLLLTEWNSLASDSHVLSGTFFRSGIIMKSLIRLSRRVTCVGFWLNFESEMNQSAQNQDSNLSLFLYGPLKRPLFFVLTLFERVGDQIISEQDHFLLTKRFNSYYLLFYNYDFLNPEDTAYKNLWKSSQKEIVFHFRQLKNGKYLVKQFLLDSNHGGVYNQWLKTGGSVAIDTDIQEYLLQSVIPDFEVKELDITGGYLEEQTNLEMNGCYLLILNRITDM